jgi:hypothetical protein
MMAQNGQAGRLAPRSDGWRERAARAGGGPAPRPSATLSASEIGAYTFCPQAWYLQRCRVPVSAETGARRRAGSRRHRDIGRQTDLVRAAGALQLVLLLAIGVALALLVVLVLRGPG